MIIEGYFPDFSAFTSTASRVYRFRKDSPSSREIVDGSVFASAVRSQVMAAAARDSGIFLTGNASAHFGPYSCKFSGEALPNPPQKLIDIYPEVKSTNNGKAWRKRDRTKEIILSPIAKGQVKVDFVNGVTKTTLQSPFFTERQLSRDGLFELYNLNKQWIIVNGWVYENSSITYPVSYSRATEIEHFPGFPLQYYIDRVRDTVNVKLDGALVTSTLADANRGTIDALTALAELPETIRSLIDLIKRCIAIYKDARLKSFRLYNKGKANLSVTQDQATLAKNAKELADAVADVWLNFRYNITPNVGLIEDLVKTLETQLKTFIRFRNNLHKLADTPFPSVDGWDAVNLNLPVVERCMIKRLIELNVDRPKVKHLVLTNVAVTGYELIPFSFVFDWFVNMGDFITAILVSPQFTAEGATYSWKQQGSVEFVHRNTQAKVFFTISQYRMVVINPRGESCLSFNPNVDTIRQLDALALSWSIFKRDIARSIANAVRK